MTVRALFLCGSVEMHSADPKGSRTFRFTATYDPSVPEEQRYARYTPIGELRMLVDNPAVSFEIGRKYYLDFTPADA